MVGDVFNKTKNSRGYFLALFQCLAVDYYCYREYAEMFEQAYEVLRETVYDNDTYSKYYFKLMQDTKVEVNTV